ncbi:GAF domain-containing protein [Calothrix sp. 336/3]|uniref:GAF domain-containing protein n=1 Tax=Calothrix sp. 336/3 TaxID=1337936 RepID=UPI00062467F7|nr:GAF domain-containing protein [Calothrix sp. 336/3]AKG20112.1 hypothetical protein IJ00_01240 [Calothrix sp. 336/3]
MFIHTNVLTQAELKSAIIQNALVVEPSITVMEAIAQMSGVRTLCSVGEEVTTTPFDDVHTEARSSCVLIVEDDKLIGIFTERDVVRLSAKQRSLHDLHIGEVMTRSVITLKESAFQDIFLAINLLNQHNIRHLPIVDDSDRLVGLLTHESLRQSLRPVDLLRLRLVTEVMSSEVVCATAKTSMLAIANLMAANRVGSVVIVVKGQIPIGIITERDLVQFQALSLDLENCPVEAVMSAPIFTAKPENSLWEVQQIMDKRRIRRIVVTNSQDELLGIVTQSSLLQLLNPIEMYKFAEVLENKISRLEAEKVEILQNRTVELEEQIQERTTTLTVKTERERLIAQIANRIRNSLNLEEILTACVAEVRAFLACDRVLVYQFQADYSGIVVSESVGDGWISSLGDYIEDSCFQEQATILYEYGRTTAIDNIYTVGYRDCHIQLLEKYQVKSNLIVPIIVSGKLWGLLIGHQCKDFRSWHLDDIALLDEMAVQLAIAIQQAIAYQQAQTELEERRKTEVRLRESEQRYATLTAAAPVGIFRTDAEGNGTYINQRGIEIIGISESTAIPNGWKQRLHPDDREKVLRESAKSRRESRPFQLEYRFLHPDARVTWVYGQAIPEFNSEGKITGYIGTITDITARRQAELLIEMQNTLLERIAKGEALKNILDALIYSIEEQLPGALCSILLCSHQGKLRSGAAPNLPEAYNQAVDGVAIGEGVGSCGTAVFRKQPVIVADIANDPLWQNFKELALSYDLQSCWSFPVITSNDEVLATFGVYHHKVYSPQARELEIINLAANIAKIAIERDRATQALELLNRDLEARVEQRTAELQERESQLEDFLDNANDLIQSVVLEDGSFEYVNRAWLQTLGYSEGEVKKLTLFDVLHPKCQQHCTDVVTQIQAGKLSTIERVELTFLTKDGREVIVEGSINCRYESHSNDKLKRYRPVATRAIFRDITDRKQAEARLQEQEQFLRSIYDGVEYPIFVIDVLDDGDFAYIDWNSSAEKFFGISRHEIFGKSPEAIYGKENGSRERQRLQHCLATNSSVTYEEKLLFPGQGETWWLTTLNPFRDSKGQIYRFVGTSFDISDRKQAEEALRQSQQFIQTVLDTFPLSVFWKNRESVYLGCNQKFAQNMGLESSTTDIIGKTDFDLSPTIDEANAYRSDDKQVMESGNAKLGIEETLTLPSGVQIWLETNKIPLRNLEGDVVGVVGTFQDITARKQAEKIIRQQAERETLLREISQRIRQSLDLQTIFETATAEIRQFIQADRVGIFKFYPESNFDDGVFVAESVVEGYTSVLGVKIHDHCFGENHSTLYKQNKMQVLNDIFHAGILDCYIDVLVKLQVRANLVVPLLNGGELWGLLCVHQCSAPRTWQKTEIEFIQQIANQLAIAIQQASLYAQVQLELVVRQQAEKAIALQLQRQQTLGAIAEQIRESLDVQHILTTVTHQVKELMDVDRVLIFRLFPDGKSRIVEEVVSSPYVVFKGKNWEDESFAQKILDSYLQGKARIVPNTSEDVWTECLQEYNSEAQIQSKIVAPILQELPEATKGRWVDSQNKTQLWGLLCVHACSYKRVWEESEALLLQQIANQLAIAIQQANFVEQIQQELAERQQAEARLTESNEKLAISNKELAHATRLKDEFLANMSHELRTPLNAILGMAEGLQEEVFGSTSEQQKVALQTVERSATHLLELINDILDLAKIEAGQVELDCSITPISPLCQASIIFIKQQAFNKSLKLNLQIPPHLPDLLIDERRIRQVLINLLNNAVKFTPEGGTITLEVTLESSTNNNTYNLMRFAVIDTGIGIEPEDQKRLFQPFIQVDSALNRQYQGTGLGLSLVKRIVELHGGSVSVSSQVGVGSRFTVDIPCVEIPISSSNSLSHSTAEVTNNITETIMNSPLILMAEDNEANIITVSSYLTAKGYRLILANNGQEAVDLANSQQPDLILMDIQMPGMDGLEAIKHIRSNPDTINIPIIALTALAMAGDREKCLEAGANDYLTKPVKLKQLANTIQGFLDNVPQ